jgi:hypothetical protein
VRKHLIKIDHPGKESWIAYDKSTYALISKIAEQGVPISKWGVHINRGILTGLNEAFIIDGETRKKLINEDRASKKVIRPILHGEDVKAYVPDYKDTWIIFVPWHFPLHHDENIQGPSKEAEDQFRKDYSAIYRHLLNHKKKLSERNSAETGIRYEWYALQRWGANYHEDFSKPKIIYPNMTNSLPFAFDEHNHYLCNDKAFIMTGEHLKFLVALLNSSLFKFAFKERFPELLGETREVRKVFFEKIPIKKPADSSQEKVFERLVDQVLKRKQADPEVDTSALEQQIDQEVYRLYQLSAEEVRLIEHSLKPSGE